MALALGKFSIPDWIDISIKDNKSLIRNSNILELRDAITTIKKYFDSCPWDQVSCGVNLLQGDAEYNGLINVVQAVGHPKGKAFMVVCEELTNILDNSTDCGVDIISTDNRMSVTETSTGAVRVSCYELEEDLRRAYLCGVKYATTGTFNAIETNVSGSDENVVSVTCTRNVYASKGDPWPIQAVYSITESDDTLKLVNDEPSPGKYKYYGTNRTHYRLDGTSKAYTLGYHAFSEGMIDVAESIITDGVGTHLKGDEESPGKSKYYGTGPLWKDGKIYQWGFFHPTNGVIVTEGTSLYLHESGKLSLYNDVNDVPPNMYYGSDRVGNKGYHRIVEGLINTTGSIENKLTHLQLMNDDNSPGEYKYYGTNDAGVRGFHTFPNLNDYVFSDDDRFWNLYCHTVHADAIRRALRQLKIRSIGCESFNVCATGGKATATCTGGNGVVSCPTLDCSTLECSTLGCDPITSSGGCEGHGCREHSCDSLGNSTCEEYDARRICEEHDVNDYSITNNNDYQTQYNYDYNYENSCDSRGNSEQQPGTIVPPGSQVVYGSTYSYTDESQHSYDYDYDSDSHDTYHYNYYYGDVDSHCDVRTSDSTCGALCPTEQTDPGCIEQCLTVCEEHCAIVCSGHCAIVCEADCGEHCSMDATGTDIAVCTAVCSGHCPNVCVGYCADKTCDTHCPENECDEYCDDCPMAGECTEECITDNPECEIDTDQCDIKEYEGCTEYCPTKQSCPAYDELCPTVHSDIDCDIFDCDADCSEVAECPTLCASKTCPNYCSDFEECPEVTTCDSLCPPICETVGCSDLSECPTQQCPTRICSTLTCTGVCANDTSCQTRTCPLACSSVCATDGGSGSGAVMNCPEFGCSYYYLPICPEFGCVGYKFPGEETYNINGQAQSLSSTSSEESSTNSDNTSLTTLSTNRNILVSEATVESSNYRFGCAIVSLPTDANGNVVGCEPYSTDPDNECPEFSCAFYSNDNECEADKARACPEFGCAFYEAPECIMNEDLAKCPGFGCAFLSLNGNNSVCTNYNNPNGDNPSTCTTVGCSTEGCTSVECEGNESCPSGYTTPTCSPNNSDPNPDDPTEPELEPDQVLVIYDISGSNTTSWDDENIVNTLTEMINNGTITDRFYYAVGAEEFYLDEDHNPVDLEGSLNFVNRVLDIDSNYNPGTETYTDKWGQEITRYKEWVDGSGVPNLRRLVIVSDFDWGSSTEHSHGPSSSQSLYKRLSEMKYADTMRIYMLATKRLQAEGEYPLAYSYFNEMFPDRVFYTLIAS